MAMTKHSSNENEELMFGDCCTFMNLGAVAVADWMFDDDNNSVASKDDDGFAFVRCGSSWTQPRLMQVSDSEDDSETLETYEEDDTLEFTVTDGETTLTKQTLEEDERNASDTDNNTMTDINTLMSSKMNDSSLAEQREKTRTIKDGGMEETKSSRKSLRKKNSRLHFDDDATLDSVEVMMFQDPYYRTNNVPSTTTPKRNSSSRRRRDNDGKENDIPKEISSPSVQKRLGTPFQLKRLVSKGRFGGKTNQYHPVPEPAMIESVVLSSKIRSKLYDEDEDVPFDEPLWYN